MSTMFMTNSPVKVLTPSRTSGAELIVSLLQYRHLLSLLIWRDINVRYKQAVIGVLWVILQPVLMAFIFAFVFSRLIQVSSDGVPYLLFAYSGATLWGLFAQGVDKSSLSILSDEHLITQVYFPRWILPLAAVGSVFLDFCATMLVLMIIVLIYGLNLGWHLLLIVPAVAFVVVVTIAAGVASAFLCAKFRDFRFLLSFLLQLGQFLTPVFYTLSLFPKKYLWLAYLNPLAGPMELFRFGLTGISHFSLWGLGLSLLMDGLLALAAFKILYELEDDLIDYL